MRSINLRSVIVAGAAGTLAMTVLMYAAPLMGLPTMDLLAALGGLFGSGTAAYLAGGLVHLGVGVSLAGLYALVFERVLPGAPWARGLQFSLAPWLLAITLMGPAMAWVQDLAGPPAEAGAPRNPCAAPAARPANPCAIRPRPANPCGAVAPRPANPCAAAFSSSSETANPWLTRMLSLAAHFVYGGVLGGVYRRRGG